MRIAALGVRTSGSVSPCCGPAERDPAARERLGPEIAHRRRPSRWPPRQPRSPRPRRFRRTGLGTGPRGLAPGGSMAARPRAARWPRASMPAPARSRKASLARPARPSSSSARTAGASLGTGGRDGLLPQPDGTVRDLGEKLAASAASREQPWLARRPPGSSASGTASNELDSAARGASKRRRTRRPTTPPCPAATEARSAIGRSSAASGVVGDLREHAPRSASVPPGSTAAWRDSRIGRGGSGGARSGSRPS